MSLSSLVTSLGGTALAGVNQSLFQIALANLNWSRGYLWYVTLEGVPSPFGENGILCLPVTEVTYNIADGKEFQWEGSMETFAVPQRKGLCTVNLTMYDDEQATMFTFFERWFNAIYNNHMGVLPITEAMRQLKIVKLKSTRRPAERHYVKNTSDKSTVDSKTGFFKLLTSTGTATDYRTLQVFPRGPLQEVGNNDSNPRVYNIELVIVKQQDADYGNPAKHDGFKITNNEKVQGFLDKVADYI